MSDRDEWPLNGLRKYANYTDKRLVKEFVYLHPMSNDPWEAAERLTEMDENDLAHFYAVCYAMALRTDTGGI